MTVCSFNDCARPLHSRRLCKAHYEQQRRGDELRPLRSQQIPDPCTFEGCDRPHVTRELCKAHYLQLWKGQELHPVGSWRGSRKPAEAARPTIDVSNPPTEALRVTASVSLPAGWLNTKPEKPRRRPGTTRQLELPPVRPLEPELLRAAGALLRRHQADDLAGMLGLT